MGQASSSQRQTRGVDSSELVRPAQRYEVLGNNGDRRQEGEGLLSEADLSQPGLLARSPSMSQRGVPSNRHSTHSTYRRETRARSTLISTPHGMGNGDIHRRDDVVLEQEERPLILRDMEVRLNDAPITDIQAAPMPRRISVLSRLGSGLSRSSPNRSRRMAGEQEDVGLTSATLTPIQPAQEPEISEAGGRRNRFSMFDFSTRGIRMPGQSSRNRRSIHEIPGVPFAEFSSDPEVAFSEGPIPVSQSENIPQSHEGEAEANMPTRSQRSRNFRRSLVAPLTHMLHSPRIWQHRDQGSSQRQAHMGEETANLISPQGTGTNASVNEPPPPTNIQRGAGEAGSTENPVELDSPDRPTSWLLNPNESARPPVSRDRPTSLISGPRDRPTSRMSSSRDRPHSWMSNSSESSREGRRRGRRLSNLLGGRSSRLVRREDDTPLSRVLQLAAAAIAAQLSGTNDASSNMQSVGDDHFDGNLNSFIQSLNSAAEASAVADEDSNMTTLPPLNFWRVFRFINSSSSNSSSSTPNQEGAPSRLMTLVVVGVRSVPSASLLGDAPGALDPSLDSILALPPPAPQTSLSGNQQEPDATSLSESGHLRRNRNPSAGFSSLPLLNEHQRLSDQLGSRLNRSSARNPLRRPPGSHPSTVHNRPPSPFPEDGRIYRQPSSTDDSVGASSMSPSSSSREAQTPGASPSSARRFDRPPSIRQRPRSGSHGHLGSGAARRNGVVEPDTVSSNGRHWLIYVVGTNLSEDHPAFQAPSLFTDSPSYEDMLMLSALLGPAKPPVATAQDVAGATGVFRLEKRNFEGNWMARLMDRLPGSDGIPSPLVDMPSEVERCLVCLTDYELGEEIRQLQSCSHVFHRECVDTWLTTGRNSCPLCRSNGVEEKSEARPEEPSPAEAGTA